MGEAAARKRKADQEEAARRKKAEEEEAARKLKTEEEEAGRRRRKEEAASLLENKESNIFLKDGDDSKASTGLSSNAGTGNGNGSSRGSGGSRGGGGDGGGSDKKSPKVRSEYASAPSAAARGNQHQQQKL